MAGYGQTSVPGALTTSTTTVGGVWSQPQVGEQQQQMEALQQQAQNLTLQDGNVWSCYWDICMESEFEIKEREETWLKFHLLEKSKWINENELSKILVCSAHIVSLEWILVGIFFLQYYGIMHLREIKTKQKNYMWQCCQSHIHWREISFSSGPLISCKTYNLSPINGYNEQSNTQTVGMSK